MAARAEFTHHRNSPDEPGHYAPVDERQRSLTPCSVIKRFIQSSKMSYTFIVFVLLCCLTKSSLCTPVEVDQLSNNVFGDEQIHAEAEQYNDHARKQSRTNERQELKLKQKAAFIQVMKEVRKYVFYTIVYSIYFTLLRN